MAGEAVTFNDSLAEVEYVQVMLRDIVYNDVNIRNWIACLGDLIPVAVASGEMKSFAEALCVIDVSKSFISRDLTRFTSG